MNPAGLVDIKVEFSTGMGGKDITVGKVVEKIDMKQNRSDVSTITGYMIVDEEGKLHNDIAYWRIKRILKQ